MYILEKKHVFGGQGTGGGGSNFLQLFYRTNWDLKGTDSITDFAVMEMNIFLGTIK